VICAPARQDDYRVAGGAADFANEGEFGPMECGCCWLVVPCAPHAPSLILLMQRKEAERHTPAEVLENAGFDPDGPPPFYRTWASRKSKGAVYVQLYEEEA
jgi:hypothetical protein